jgi:hypothetical protein
VDPLQKISKFGPTPMEIGFDRPDRYFHDVSDFFVGVAFHVSQKDGCPVFGSKLSDGDFELPP